MNNRLMNLYMSGELVFTTDDKEKIWNEIGESWNVYEVRYSDDNELVMDFLPF